MDNLPWFKFYVLDYLGGDITDHGAEAQGIFVAVITRAWKAGGSWKRSDEKLARTLQVSPEALSNCLALLIQDEILVEMEDGSLTADFIQEQLADYTTQSKRRQEISAARALAGGKGGRAKRKQLLSKDETNKPNASESDSDCEYDQIIEDDADTGFREFWDLYPRKEDLLPALLVWDKLSTDQKAMAIIKVAQYAMHCQQEGIKCVFIKLASTWLERECWNDVYTSTPKIAEEKNAKVIALGEEWEEISWAVKSQKQVDAFWEKARQHGISNHKERIRAVADKIRQQRDAA